MKQSPNNEPAPASGEQDNTKIELTRKEKYGLALGGLALAAGYVGVFGGYVDVRGHNRYDASYGLTPKGHAAVEQVVNTLDSAAGAVTAILRTAPDKNGESVEFSILDPDELSPVSDYFSSTPEVSDTELGE